MHSNLDTCDACGKRAELYYNEPTGLAYCDDCETQANAAEARADLDLEAEKAAEARQIAAAEAERESQANRTALAAVEYALTRILDEARDGDGSMVDRLGTIGNYAALARNTLRAVEAAQAIAEREGCSPLCGAGLHAPACKRGS